MDFEEYFTARKNDKNVVRKFFRSHPHKGIAGHNTWYWLTNPHRIITEIPSHYARLAKWFVQRGRRGYADSDTWSLDQYLASWLPDALKDLRKNAHTRPQDVTADEWGEILSRIEQGFRAARAVGIECSPRERDRLTDQFNEGWELMGEFFFDLWD